MAKGNIKVCLHNYNSKQNCSLLDICPKTPFFYTLLCHAFRWSYQVTVSLTSCSILTASQISSLILLVEGLCFSLLYMRQAKSQCKPSSLLISSLENVKPGIRPLWDKGRAVSIKNNEKCFKQVSQVVETSYSTYTVNRILMKHLCT